MPRPTSIAAPALITGFAVLLPIPGVRGALVGLFPGLAFRKLGVAAKGAVLGFAADVGYQLGWFVLGLVWEPRGEYNRILAHFLPPDHIVCTHCACPIPNSVQFILGFAGWAMLFFLIWTLIWPQKLPAIAYSVVPLAGAFLISVAATILWIFAPMNQWSGRFDAAPHTLGDTAFFILLVSSIPLCALAVGLLLADTGNFEEKTLAGENETRVG